MKAIRTWYVGPTGLRGSRYCATDGDGCRVLIDHDPEWSTDRCHHEAVLALCQKRGWVGKVIEGHLMKGGKLDCRVWVWADFGKHQLPSVSLTIHADGYW